MKKIIFIMILIIGSVLLSCNSKYDNLKAKGYNYNIIDTTSVATTGFGGVTGYHLIIEVDSALYSAFMNNYGVIRELNRKLKVRK